MAIVYLDQLLLAESSIPVSEFHHLDSLSERRVQGKQSNMIIDAQALEHLEILESANRSNSKFDGTLLTILSQNCQTSFGKRLMKRWLVSPLFDVDKIKAR